MERFSAVGVLLAFLACLAGAPAKPPKVTDAKSIKLEGEAPPRDPALADYAITRANSPRAAKAPPLETSLPLRLENGDRICLIGNLLLDAERRYGHLETLVHQLHPDHALSFRNLAWPADEIDLMPRPDNFGDLDQHLTYFQADVIIAAFGYNESFAGVAGIPSFKKRLDRFLDELKGKAYNGKSPPRVVLLSPQQDARKAEGLAPNTNNLLLYTDLIKEAAARHQVAFIDVLDSGSDLRSHRQEPEDTRPAKLRVDGHANTAAGHALFAQAAVEAMFGKEAPFLDEDLRELVVDKATQFFHRYRPLNTFYYTGGRRKTYGYLDFLPAMRNFDLMVANRDQAIHATLTSGEFVEPDDAHLPGMDEVLLARGANQFLAPAAEQKAFRVDPRFEVNCFASEEDFPELACPITMRWDQRGRLWVSTSVTYPHVYPGQEPRDKIIILEDSDQDGKADRCTTWADDLHLPLSFELDGRGGVYCSEQPHLTHLSDRDGDGKMDHREIVFTGFGCEDSHHSLHDFTWTPGGDLMFRESIFHHSQVETIHGPIRAKNSSWFLYRPGNKKLIAFGSYPNTNPWGVTFDRWGNHVASHPVFASTFHATNPAYPRAVKVGNGFQQEQGQHPPAKGMQAYSGTCGHAFIDHPFWPTEMQGGFLKARYKPTNRIEFHRWIEKDDHFAEDYQFDLIFSTNLSFIPVDLNFGPRGACYVCDWYNPVKGHAQYSLRDPRRDRKAGRIWRIVPKKAALSKAPEIAGASVGSLLELLKSRHHQTRFRARLELRTRNENEVSVRLKEWRETLEAPLHRLEALWMQQALGLPILDGGNFEFLESVIRSDDHRVAASAFGVLRFAGVPPSQVERLLRYGATHPSQHVRREAVLCASYVVSSQSNPDPLALDTMESHREAIIRAILPVFEQPADIHLQYAIRTALSSGALKPYWPEGMMEKLAGLEQAEPSPEPKLTGEERRFDRQKGLQTVTIGTIPERLLYTRDKFVVTTGQPVKLIFNNPDATEHNLLILEAGTPVAEIGQAANEMAKSPAGAKKQFIPDDERILHASRLLKTGESETLRFTAPKKPGRYPFVCTFPGHWTIMQGIMTVE